MKVLDASFLIDYEEGVEEAKTYLLDNRDDEFVVPAPIHTEYLLGEVHSHGKTDLDAARHEISWATVHPTTERTSDLAVEIADEIGPQGPHLTAIDALIAGMGYVTSGYRISWRDGVSRSWWGVSEGVLPVC